MKLNAKFTKEPLANKIKSPFLAKNVVDKDGARLCFLQNGKLYDLNGEFFATCIRISGDEDNIPEDQFVTDGKSLMRNGLIEGRINRTSEFRLLALVLSFLLLLSSVALIVVTKDYFDPVLPEFTVVDLDGVWGINGRINVFGKDLIKPGDKGVYSFMVNNPTRINLKCRIIFTINYDDRMMPPINYSVVSEGETLKAIPTENGFELRNLIVKAKDSRAFYLEWNWDFDGDDVTDTQIGILGKEYKVKVEIFAEEA